MKITGQAGPAGTTFTIEIGKLAAAQMAQTPNQSPSGLSLEDEMSEFISTFLPLVELAFAAPEPLRRGLVGIVSANVGRTARELRDAVAEVRKICAAKVARGN